jgi:protein TonB
MAMKSWGFPPYAIALSLALHALVLAALAPSVAEPVRALPPAAVLHGRLQPAPAVEPAPARVEQRPVRSEAPRRPARVEAASSLSSSTVPPAPTFSAESTIVPGAATGGETLARPVDAPATTALRRESAARGPSESGLRQYRLALASEARRFRRYPEAARRAGLAGTAEVRVTVAAGGANRRAELSRSSGHEALDAAALEMLRQATWHAALPESLHGQSFAVLLPVVFEVEE